MRIEYYERNGRVGVCYVLSITTEPRPEWDMHLEEVRLWQFKAPEIETDLGFVPQNIQAEGMEAIKRYATKTCNDHLEARRERLREAQKARDHRMNNVDLPLTASHGDVTLRGRLVNNPGGRGVLVELHEPIRFNGGIVLCYPTCYAEAVHGAHVFERDGSLTKYVTDDAHRRLVDLYLEAIRRQKHGDVLDLVNGLNRDD